MHIFHKISVSRKLTPCKTINITIKINNINNELIAALAKLRLLVAKFILKCSDIFNKERPTVVSKNDYAENT